MTPVNTTSLFGRLTRLTALVEDGLLTLLLTSMIGLAISQVLLRNIWDEGLAWGDPLLRLMLLWLGLLGAMVATRQRNHIQIDLLSRLLPQRAQVINRLVTDLFAAGVCGLLAYHGARFVAMEREDGTLAFAGIPVWLGELIIPVAFGIMALRFALSSVQRLISKTDDQGEEQSNG